MRPGSLHNSRPIVCGTFVKEKNMTSGIDESAKLATRNRVLSWRDTYVERIDSGLRDGWPALKDRLEATVSDNPLSILKMKPSTFVKTKLQPEIESWIKARAQPVMDDAVRDMEEIWQGALEQDGVTAPVTDGAEGGRGLEEVGLALGPLVAGIAASVAAVVAGIGVFLWFFVTINWPILIGGLAVGAVLTGLGFAQTAKLKETLFRRFTKTFIPKIRAALIGEGYTHKGEHHPSTRKQLITKIEESADKTLNELKQAGAA